MAWLKSNLQTLLLAALGLVLLAVLRYFFPGFPISYALVFGIGVLVGVGELVSRYRDAPEQAVRTKPAVIYVLLNALAAVAAFVLVVAYDVVKGTGDGPAITRVLLAGFGAMAFSAPRSSRSASAIRMYRSVRSRSSKSFSTRQTERSTGCAPTREPKRSMRAWPGCRSTRRRRRCRLSAWR